MHSLEQLSSSEDLLRGQEAGAAILALETSPDIARAHEVAMAIDPEGVLPDVSVVPDPSARVGRGSLVPQQSLIMHGDVQVGKCTLMSDNKTRARWFNGIEVTEKGAGFGSAAYKDAITSAMVDGYSFQTHGWSQTEGAKRVWERFAEAGIARVVEPFAPDGHGKYTGHYVIDAAEIS